MVVIIARIHRNRSTLLKRIGSKIGTDHGACAGTTILSGKQHLCGRHDGQRRRGGAARHVIGGAAVYAE
jgi:hypothetical protein